MIRLGGTGERRSPASANVAEKGELTDDEDFTIDVADVEIHLPGLISEHPQTNDLVDGGPDLAIPVSGLDPYEEAEPSPDLGHQITLDRDRGPGDSLQHHSHKARFWQ